MLTPRYTIILAEDTEDIRVLLKVVLEMRGYRVVEAVDGQQVLDLVSRERPDLILMDLNMPVLDGWEATRRLRKDPAMRAIPIIALSAYCSGGWEEKALAAGCTSCVVKPIDSHSLDKVIMQFLGDF